MNNFIIDQDKQDKQAITENPKIQKQLTSGWNTVDPCATKYDARTLPLVKSDIKTVINNSNKNKISWEEPILFDEIETPEIPASLLLPGSLGKFAAALALASETVVRQLSLPVGDNYGCRLVS